jgi:hypothetical protein
MSTVDRLRRFVEEHTPRQHGVPQIITWGTTHEGHGTLTGFGVCWPDHNGDRALMLCDIEMLHTPVVRAEQCGYIVDDGASVLPYCVSRWCLHEGSSSCAPWIPGGYLTLRRQHPRPVEAAHPPRRVWHLIIRAQE